MKTTDNLGKGPHVGAHASMVHMSTSRRTQPQFSFRLDEGTAEEFRQWQKAEALQAQAIMETLVHALLAGDLPDLRELRRQQIARASTE